MTVTCLSNVEHANNRSRLKRRQADLPARRPVFVVSVAMLGWLIGCQGFVAVGTGRASAQDPPSTAAVEPIDLIEPELSLWKTRGNWSVDAEGVLHLKPKRRSFRLFPDVTSFLWSDRPYRDFQLDLEFRLSEGARSGIFFRASSVSDYLEIQLADSAGKALPLEDDDCAGLVDHVAPSENRVKPAGQWNQMRIHVRGDDLRVWLNDGEVLKVDLSERAETRGLKAGRLGIQNQSDAMSFRNIKILNFDS